MKQREQNNHSIDFLFIMLTFLMYAGSMIALVYMGAQVYQSVTAQMNNHYATRTAQAYISEKVRQNDRAGCISVTQLDGHDALAFYQSVEDSDYVTYIYSYEGSLMELFTRADREVSAGSGTEILKLPELSIEEREDGFLEVFITDNAGFTRSFWIHRESDT